MVQQTPVQYSCATKKTFKYGRKTVPKKGVAAYIIQMKPFLIAVYIAWIYLSYKIGEKPLKKTHFTIKLHSH